MWDTVVYCTEPKVKEPYGVNYSMCACFSPPQIASSFKLLAQLKMLRDKVDY